MATALSLLQHVGVIVWRWSLRDRDVYRVGEVFHHYFCDVCLLFCLLSLLSSRLVMVLYSAQYLNVWAFCRISCFINDFGNFNTILFLLICHFGKIIFMWEWLILSDLILHFILEVDWGDSHQAHVYKNALSNLLRLSNTEVHVKNYRPQILLLSGNPVSRLPLLDFAHAITKGDSLLICSHILNVSNYYINRLLITLLNDNVCHLIMSVLNNIGFTVIFAKSNWF